MSDESKSPPQDPIEVSVDAFVQGIANATTEAINRTLGSFEERFDQTLDRIEDRLDRLGGQVAERLAAVFAEKMATSIGFHTQMLGEIHAALQALSQKMDRLLGGGSLPS